jgi:hypothetical protein
MLGEIAGFLSGVLVQLNQRLIDLLEVLVLGVLPVVSCLRLLGRVVHAIPP